jgi:hypothetical protein
MKLAIASLAILWLTSNAAAQTRPCDRFTPFQHTVATGPVEIAPPIANQRIYFCGFALIEKGTTLDFVAMTGTGTNCGTDTIEMFRLELPNDLAFVNRIEMVGPSGDFGRGLCIQTIGPVGARLTGVIYWAQF